MAGQQRVSASYGDAEMWREESGSPSHREGQPSADAPQGSRREARESARRGGTPRRGGLHPALPLLGLPVLGAVADEFTSSAVGMIFAVCAVLGTAVAAALSTKAGWWWITTAAPVVVLTVASGAEYLANGDKYQGKALATGALKWVIHAFPVMALAVVAALLVIVVQSVRSGGDRRG